MKQEQVTIPTEAAYRIEQVAAQTGLTKRTIRYYEELGLCAPPARTEGNYRLYTAADIARLERIGQLKDALGLSLAEIKTMILTEEQRAEIRVAYHNEHDPAQRLDQLARAEVLTRQQLALVENKLAALAALKQELADRLALYATRLTELTAALGER